LDLLLRERRIRLLARDQWINQLDAHRGVIQAGMRFPCTFAGVPGDMCGVHNVGACTVNIDHIVAADFALGRLKVIQHGLQGCHLRCVENHKMRFGAKPSMMR